MMICGTFKAMFNSLLHPNVSGHGRYAFDDRNQWGILTKYYPAGIAWKFYIRISCFILMFVGVWYLNCPVPPRRCSPIRHLEMRPVEVQNPQFGCLLKHSIESIRYFPDFLKQTRMPLKYVTKPIKFSPDVREQDIQFGVGAPTYLDLYGGQW